MWFLRGRAPPHFGKIVHEHVENPFLNSWVRGNGPLPWPACSSDLTRSHFFLWGYLKQFEYPNSCLLM